MPVERLIGIDFGTSMSVVRVKHYKDGQPMEDRKFADFIRFNNRHSIPTLIYETRDGKYLVGYEAENAAVAGELHQNFKLDLISQDAAEREAAERYTGVFLNYVYKAYAEQSVMFPSCGKDGEKTYVSYPAKWPQRVCDTMLRLTCEAGFKNVEGVDEPTAAVQTVLAQEGGRLKLDGGEANVLLIDMGAGTTDLVLFRLEELGVSIIDVWPKADSSGMFGGREIDDALTEYIKAYLVNCGVPNTRDFKRKYSDKCRVWKEANVSPVLRAPDGVVRYCGFVDAIISLLNVELDFPPLTRTGFEEMLQDYLSQLPRMVNDCLDDAGMSHDALDYVILTGGHSQWYFVEDILRGGMLRLGRLSLPKIQRDKDRIIALPIPQETVALGLVYQGLKPEYIGERQAPLSSAEPVFPCAPAAYAIPQYTGEQALATVPQNALAQPLRQPQAKGKTELYVLQPGKSTAGIRDAALSVLAAKNMQTQTLQFDGGNVSIQARDKGGKWKQFIGMDLAVTITIEDLGNGIASVTLSESKWMDKGIVMGISMFVLWPLAVTSGVGMYMQGKLPSQVKEAITAYLAAPEALRIMA